jgi:hypothetical protein
MKYTELEFVCHNSEFPESTRRGDQRKLFAMLKKIPGTLTYTQDFSDASHAEVSLATVILDGKKSTASAVKRAAKVVGVNVDLTSKISGSKVDEIVAGRLEFLADVSVGML